MFKLFISRKEVKLLIEGTTSILICIISFITSLILSTINNEDMVIRVILSVFDISKSSTGLSWKKRKKNKVKYLL